MKKFFQEFGAFIKRGNVLDLAVGLIIGTSFNAIVRSLVNDIIMPLIGLAGGKNISEARYELVPAVMEGTTVVTPAVTLNYGAFIQTIIDFLIIALSIFIAVRIITKLRERMERRAKLIKGKFSKGKEIEEEPKTVMAPAKPTTEEILTDIKNILIEQNKKIDVKENE